MGKSSELTSGINGKGSQNPLAMPRHGRWKYWQVQPRYLAFQNQTNKMKPNKHLVGFCLGFPSLQLWLLTDTKRGGK